MAEPRAGDFGLLAGHDPVGKLIEFAELLNGDGFAVYSHAMLMMPNGRVLEAEPGGARVADPAEYSDPIVWSDWPLTEAQRGAIVAAGAALLGTPYSFLDYVALAVARLRLPFPGVRRRVESSGHLICSQLVDQAYHDAGIEIFADHRWPGLVTPQDLAAALHGPVTAG